MAQERQPNFRVRTPAVAPTAFADILQRRSQIELQKQQAEENKKQNRFNQIIQAISVGSQIANNMATRAKERREFEQRQKLAESTSDLFAPTGQSSVINDGQPFNVRPTQEQSRTQEFVKQMVLSDPRIAESILKQRQERIAPETAKGLGLSPNTTVKQAELELKRQESAVDQLNDLKETKIKVQQGIIDNSKDLRNEFIKQSDAFRDTSEAIERIRASAKNPSAAGDLALVFNYMKVLDPGSTVREGEFANAENSAGIPARIRALHNKALSGKRLAPETRKDFISRAEKLYQGQQKVHNKRVAEYKRLSNVIGADPNQVIVDFTNPQPSLDSFVIEE